MIRSLANRNFQPWVVAQHREEQLWPLKLWFDYRSLGDSVDVKVVAWPNDAFDPWEYFQSLPAQNLDLETDLWNMQREVSPRSKQSLATEG